MNIKALAIGCGIILVAAIPSGFWAYEYYILLRWFICISSLVIAYGFYKSKLESWALIFGAIAFLFNPLVPIYLSKETWVLIDFVSAILFFMAASSAKKIR